MANKKYFGYFEDNSDKPAYDPGKDTECLVCMKKLSSPMVTNSLMPLGGNKSYFFRTHNACWNNLTSQEQKGYEDGLIDNL